MKRLKKSKKKYKSRYVPRPHHDLASCGLPYYLRDREGHAKPIPAQVREELLCVTCRAPLVLTSSGFLTCQQPHMRLIDARVKAAVIIDLWPLKLRRYKNGRIILKRVLKLMNGHG